MAPATPAITIHAKIRPFRIAGLPPPRLIDTGAPASQCPPAGSGGTGHGHAPGQITDIDDGAFDAPRICSVSAIGLLATAPFFAAALSLMPRLPLLRGAVRSLSADIDYLIGALLLWLWRALELPVSEGAAERGWRSALALVSLVICGWARSSPASWRQRTPPSPPPRRTSTPGPKPRPQTR
jgi:hypothetical protein